MKLKIQIIKQKEGKSEPISYEYTTDCRHIWKHGYTLEPVVYCEKCNKYAGQIYNRMPYDEQIRLIIDNLK